MTELRHRSEENPRQVDVLFRPSQHDLNVVGFRPSQRLVCPGDECRADEVVE